MIASLTRWWQSLSAREQRLVGVAGALAAAVLLWLVLRPLVGSPRTELLVAWMTRNPSTVLREFLDVVRRYAAR